MSVLRVGAPLAVARAGGLGERRAVRIRAREPAEIPALAGIGAGDEEAQGVALRVNARCVRRQQCDRKNCHNYSFHASSSDR